MRIVRNKFIPFPGYKCINLFGILFVRENAKLAEETITHESIHTSQMKEMLYIFFYLWYGIEFLIRWAGTWFSDWNKSYRGISFEREAYNNEDNPDYLKTRKHYAWLKYI